MELWGIRQSVTGAAPTAGVLNKDIPFLQILNTPQRRVVRALG